MTIAQFALGAAGIFTAVFIVSEVANPARRFEQHDSWFYRVCVWGVAISIAFACAFASAFTAMAVVIAWIDLAAQVLLP